MECYKPPINEMMFLLRAFDYDKEIQTLPAFEGFDLETIKAILDLCGNIGVKELLPLNRKGDEEGLGFDPETGAVTTPEGFKEAYKVLTENGLIGICGSQEYGGMGGPEVLGTMTSELITACNKSFSMCPGLTRGLVDAILAYGSDEQKEEYLPNMMSGTWSGTMCLTEPQSGTDLGLISTKAEPKDDGSYSLTGTKIWITFGEHDMAENIIHLVLARLPDAPEGIKGISAFLVPKIVDGKQNGIICSGLEHKMGIKASPTCVMNLENATGYLMGVPHKGMRSMFVMMNAARLHVGLEGIALGEIAYQTALEFAKERRQSRSLDPEKQDQNASADNIMVHPDVRRMLLDSKVSTDALRGLGTWLAIEYDKSHYLTDEVAKQESADLVALLTPVIKSYGSERGFENISDSMQVCGGAGYTTDWDIEQYLRDERIAMIYEGTNHIQALDLVGRKLLIDNGRLFRVFNSRIGDLMRETKGDEELAMFRESLKNISKTLGAVTMEMAGSAMADREVVGAVASPYLNLFAYTAMSYIWLKMVHFAKTNNEPTAATKHKFATYFFQKMYPEHLALIPVIKAGKGNIMEFDLDEF